MSDTSVFVDGFELKTLCYLFRIHEDKPQILLAKHKKQKKWNGFGGKVGDLPEFKEETIVEGAIREGIEEIGVKVTNLIPKGIITFLIEGSEKIVVNVFLADEWEGEPRGIEVDEPTWFDVDDLPWEEMWPVDKTWLRQLIESDHFIEAEIAFGNTIQEEVIKFEKTKLLNS